MQPFGPVETPLKGRHFDGQIIILCVSWYTSFKLSLRDLVIMMAVVVFLHMPPNFIDQFCSTMSGTGSIVLGLVETAHSSFQWI